MPACGRGVRILASERRSAVRVPVAWSRRACEERAAFVFVRGREVLATSLVRLFEYDLQPCMAPDGYFKVNVKTHVESWNLPLPEGCPEAFEEHGAFTPPPLVPSRPEAAPDAAPQPHSIWCDRSRRGLRRRGGRGRRVSAGSCAATCLPAGSA